jgi:mannose-6-phosphate isomerase-like protein (cupin superfamily)
MVARIRRLVTGHDAGGKAVCVSDAPATCVVERGGTALTDLWQTDTVPAPIDGPEETTDRPLVLHPPAGGTLFRIVEFPPENPEIMKAVDGRAVFAAIGAADAIVDDPRHPFMHRTHTVDYAIILKGAITLLLDETEHDMKAGDVVVQRGTTHAWSNRGTSPCLVAFILIDGKRG